MEWSYGQLVSTSAPHSFRVLGSTLSMVQSNLAFTMVLPYYFPHWPAFTKWADVISMQHSVFNKRAPIQHGIIS